MTSTHDQMRHPSQFPFEHGNLIANSPAGRSLPWTVPDDRGGAADLHHLHGGADLDHLGLVEGPGRPLAPVEPDPAVLARPPGSARSRWCRPGPRCRSGGARPVRCRLATGRTPSSRPSAPAIATATWTAGGTPSQRRDRAGRRAAGAHDQHQVERHRLGRRPAPPRGSARSAMRAPFHRTTNAVDWMRTIPTADPQPHAVHRAALWSGVLLARAGPPPAGARRAGGCSWSRCWSRRAGGTGRSGSRQSPPGAAGRPGRGRPGAAGARLRRLDRRAWTPLADPAAGRRQGRDRGQPARQCPGRSGRPGQGAGQPRPRRRWPGPAPTRWTWSAIRPAAWWPGSG